MIISLGDWIHNVWDLVFPVKPSAFLETQIHNTHTHTTDSLRWLCYLFGAELDSTTLWCILTMDGGSPAGFPEKKTKFHLIRFSVVSSTNY